jgi:O-antigen/teichoic acid export membrane protein
MTIVLGCAVLNIALNLVLVPRIGIVGAAIATLISYAASALAAAFASRRLLPVALPWATITRAGSAAAVMYGSLLYVYPGHRLVTVAVRVVLGGIVYGTLMMLIDSDARGMVRGVRARFAKKAGR